MSKYLGVVVASVVACASSSAYADTPQPLALSESEFLAAFERGNPAFALLDANVARAAVAVGRVDRLPNPSLIIDREQVFGDGAGSAETSLGVGWSIDLSGRRTRAVRGARHHVSAERMRGAASRVDARVTALSVYRNAAYRRLRVALLESERAPLQQVLDTLRRRASAGDVAGYDLMRIKIELAVYDDKLRSAKAELATARAHVARLVGDVRGLRDAGDNLRVPAMPGSAASLIDGGLASRPDYRALSSELDVARANRAAASRWWIPSINVSVGFKSADSASGYFAGLSVDVPVFSRGQSARQDARAMTRQTKARMRILARDIPAKIRSAHGELTRAVVQAKAYETSVVSNVGTLVTKATARYRGGEGAIVELVDAHRLSRETHLRHLELRHKARQIELSLWRALGRIPGRR